MCFKRYMINCCGLNLLIFGTCILTLSIEAVLDIKNHKLKNTNNLNIVCIALIVVSSCMIISSLSTIRKISYTNFNYDML